MPVDIVKTHDTQGVERFFAYALKREAIRIRREDNGIPRPWTKDPILQRYRFCNVFREDDRTTRWFKKYVREPMRDQPEVLLATVLFRWFNRISTGEAIFKSGAWEAFRQTGEIDVLRQAILKHCGAGPYVTGSYTIATPVGMNKLEGVLHHFGAFARSWREMLASCTSLEQAWERLREEQGLGNFMAYEAATDLRHTSLLEHAPDINTFANPGPGARRGLNRIHGRNLECDPGRAVLLAEMQELLELSRTTWPDEILGVPVPPFELREIEHTLCEFDKYERARLGQGRPRGVFDAGSMPPARASGEQPPPKAPDEDMFATVAAEVTLGTGKTATKWSSRVPLRSILPKLTEAPRGQKDGSCYTPAIFRGERRAINDADQIVIRSAWSSSTATAVTTYMKLPPLSKLPGMKP